ncbi:MAG: cell division protein ZapA [Paludibacteraceae bacterium]|nr:cell division protein ZapA [Paludibacteraceae bacterium]
MTEDKQNITLQLDSFRFAFKVERDKESIYRRAAEICNRSFQSYRKAMPKASTEMLWAYVALQMGCNLCSDARDKDLQPIEEKINQINELIQKYTNQTL